MQGPLRKSHKIVIQGPAAGADLIGSWYKNLPRGSQKEELWYKHFYRHGICKLLMQEVPGEDLTTISTRSSVKDPYRRMQRPLKKIKHDLHKSPFMRELRMKMPRTQSLWTPRCRRCASLRNPNAQRRLTRAILNCHPHSRNTHGHLIRAMFCENRTNAAS